MNRVPQFSYIARNFEGQRISGIVEAENLESAGERLQEQGFFIVNIKPAKIGKQLIISLERRVGSSYLRIFCTQLATMLDAGLSLLASLKILEQQSETRKMRKVIKGVLERLEGGASFAQALSFYPRVFPDILVNMVAAGETGGVLDEVLFRMAEHFEKEHEIYEKIKNALTYPMVVIAVAVAAVFFLVSIVLPAFSDILQNMQIPLPLPTKIVMEISIVIRKFWFLFVLLFVLAGFGIHRFLKDERGRYRWDEWKLHLPVVGHLQQKIIISRFCRTLGTLLRGGVPILRSLEVVERTAGNALVIEGVEKARDSIRDGKGMSGPLAESGVFPPMVTHMVKVGEETGALDKLLEKVSDYYDQEIEYIVSRLTSLIEPVLIVGLGLVVGFIIISILLPMFNVVSTMI